ncbi:iron-sulfur cluster insertion protein ErpA [Ferrovibrio xuzhouensis]|uniref:Iron-sulfur cluster insertion protein ErpA n=1 Tax=Ferrovibrio xuzhouensis TaxID=1576914 RepID=A0ABV7VJ78_9PROT
MTDLPTQTSPQNGAQTAPADAGAAPVTVSASAARRVRTIVAQDGNPAMALRISVSGGGCSGFQYGFTLDDAETADDIVIERDGARVVIDTVSVEYLRGAEIDFIEDLTGAYFKIANPQASSSCGCGNSFAI